MGCCKRKWDDMVWRVGNAPTFVWKVENVPTSSLSSGWCPITGIGTHTEGAFPLVIGDKAYLCCWKPSVMSMGNGLKCFGCAFGCSKHNRDHFCMAGMDDDVIGISKMCDGRSDVVSIVGDMRLVTHNGVSFWLAEDSDGEQPQVMDSLSGSGKVAIMASDWDMTDSIESPEEYDLLEAVGNWNRMVAGVDG